ncbi:gluconate 2-dehydrogenase subunit 3 family protein [Halovenus sp. HT40]|uniref:gluconate 2-dehydrogenase subunit 3 family protein n=1 Tax=Halovenus sp. HT40 TaxID=3126691 RepID=UPI00300F6C8B
MELTRRDALLALGGGATLGVGALAVSERTEDDSADGTLDDGDLSTLLALAEAIYPAEVAPTMEFVRTYVEGHRQQRQHQIIEAIERLDAGSRRFTGSDFANLPESKRTVVLGRVGVDRAQSDPDGSVPERIRYHLVNSLLYALFSSPTGSELVGIENPTGHPGGYESLARTPEEPNE